MKSHPITTSEHIIVFMDIHNYSIVARALGRAQAGFLQEIYEKVGDIILKFQGEIIKYMGDGILCLFPPDVANEVIACCIEAREAYDNLVKRRDIRQETELEVGIGAGEVEVGIFGHPSLQQKDVFGEEVNRAAMIGHHRGIALTESVYEQIKGTYKTARLADRQLKWQPEPLKVWEIVRGRD